MLIRTYRLTVLGTDDGKPSYANVFTDLGDELKAAFLDNSCAAFENHLAQCINISWLLVQDGLRHRLGKTNKVLVLCNEIRFGVYLDNDSLAAVLPDDDAAVGCNTTGLLVRFGLTGFAQMLSGSVDSFSK